jgi:hypothetical protein
MLRLLTAIASASLLAVSGCAKDDALRAEGLTLGAGDAVAVNSSLQIIDPWPAGVEDADLIIPSDRGDAVKAAAADAGATSSASATTGSSAE